MDKIKYSLLLKDVRLSKILLSQTFSSDGTANLSLEISLHTCDGDSARNSSLSTTSLK